MMMKKYLVDESLLEHIALYLSKRPYEEVADKMALLANLRPYEPETPRKSRKRSQDPSLEG